MEPMNQDIRQPAQRVQWKRKYEERKHQAHMLLREVDALNRQLAEVPAPVRAMCRIIGRMLRGRA